MSDKISLAQCRACPVCLETKRDARLLPCLHSLCRGCIDNLAITADKDAPCPVCRANFHISESGGTAFPKDTVTSSARPAAKCDECGDELVTMFCRSCQLFLCDAHIGSHEKSGKKKWHLFTDTSDVSTHGSSEATGVSLVETAFPSCPDHGEQKFYHCLDCDTPICGGCGSIGSHRAHNIKHAKDIVSQRKEEIANKLDKLRADIEPRLVKSIEEVDGVTGQLRTRADQVRGEIRSATDKAVQMVKAVGEQLVQQVTDTEDERCKLLDQQRGTLKHHLDSVRNAISFGDCLLDQELRVECFPQLVTLDKRVVNLSEEEMVLKPVRHAKLRFQGIKDSLLAEKAFLITGKVFSGCGSANNSTIKGSTAVRVYPGANDKPAMFVLQVKDEQDTPVDPEDDEITTRWLKLAKGETSKVPVTITSQHNSGQYLLSTRPTRLGKYELEVAVNGEALSSCLSVEAVDLMQFEAKECHPEIKLSSDRRTATFTQTTSTYKSVLGSVGMRRGRFSWKIKIGSKESWHVLGIASKPLSNQTSNYNESYGWSSSKTQYVDQGSQGHKHDNKPITSWQGNDCIHFILDCDQHTLQMTNTRSGESHEITGLPDKEFFVYVNMYKIGNSTEFVS